jgi:hypothetical protein
MRTVIPAAFALAGVLCGTMPLSGARRLGEPQQKSYPGGHWEPSGGSANQVGYTGEYASPRNVRRPSRYARVAGHHR